MLRENLYVSEYFVNLLREICEFVRNIMIFYFFWEIRFVEIVFEVCWLFFIKFLKFINFFVGGRGVFI